MMKNLACWLLVLALCAVGASAAFASPDDGQAKGDAPSSAKCYWTVTEPSGGDKNGKGYTLRIVEKKGAKFAYDNSSSMSISLDFTKEELEQMDDEQTAILKQAHGFERVCRVNHEVVKVENGRFTFSTTVIFSKFKGEGLVEPMVEKARDKMVFPYLSTTDDRGGGFEMPHDASLEPVICEPSSFTPYGEPYPQKPIRVGDEWDSTYERPGFPCIKLKVKFVGVETVKGREALRIDQTALGIAGIECLDGAQAGSEWIDPTNGRILKQELTINFRIQEHVTGKMTIRNEAVD